MRGAAGKSAAVADQHPVEPGVVAVDIRGEVDRPVLRRHHGGEIEEDHADRARELDTLRGRLVHRLENSIARPFRLAAEHPLREPDRVLHPHAPVAEVAARAGEQRRRRRAVHVDVVVVREDELDQPQRVGRARTLPHAKRLSRARDHFHVVPREIVRLPAIAGRISWRTIEDGTFQYGRKTISRSSSTNTGVRVLSARPTITPVWNEATPSGRRPSHAHSRNIGMLTAMNRRSSRCGSQRSRSSASSSLPDARRRRRGLGPAMQDLIAGRIDYMCDSPSTSRPQIETNNVKAIATTGAKRTSVLPVVPTAREQGLDFEVMTWQGLFLPKDTPDPIVRHLNQALSATLDLPFVRERFKAVGEDVAPVERRSPEYFAKFVAAEIDKWSGPIKASGVSVD